MRNEKDRADIITAEFAFRMQTDQGHGARGRYQITQIHTQACRQYFTAIHCLLLLKKRTADIIFKWFGFNG